MIPYFQYNAILIGPVPIQVWGLMVALGIVAAVLLMQWLAKKYFLSPEVVLDLTLWCLIPAFIFARLFHVVFYNLDYFLLHPAEIFAVWSGGASSFGGFIGAALGAWLFAKRRKFSWKEFVPYCDIAALGLWLGWGIGRIGCFLIHDHLGTLSHFLLSVNYPGGARHDLGLYESILGFVLFIIFALSFQRLVKMRWGLVATLSSLLYAVSRFFLDFLRATDLPGSDIRYAQLTPAQWGMLLIVVALTASLISVRLKRQNKPMSS
ncbi:MAG: prolipoprotein diacylglyceryl transferase [Candidatus Magasanikbacteria bacterium]|nr:prolipoprotein diacylglyceryl transferase [Candidatus Magasanikbacteria bacterium]